MAQNRIIEDLGKRISEIIAATPAKDLEKNIRVMLAGAFERLDLVTREELDIQAKVLARTRGKLSELETRIAELESRLRQ